MENIIRCLDFWYLNLGNIELVNNDNIMGFFDVFNFLEEDIFLCLLEYIFFSI